MSRHIISSPHKHDGSSVNAIMREVVLALLPGIIVYALLISWAILLQCMLAVSFALVAEAAMLRLRRLPVQPFLTDYSVVITALLFALCIPPLTPWWITLGGILFAVMVAKHAYGGIGGNLFNPAMAGFVFVLLCFPVEMNHWPVLQSSAGNAPVFTDVLHMIVLGHEDVTAMDTVTAATPLSHLQTQVSGMHMITEFNIDPRYGLLSGAGWEWVALALLAGGVWLAFRRIITWQVPLTMIATLLLVSVVFYGFDADVYASPLFHIFTVSTLLGAFFIITDPVSSATTPAGRLVFAAGVGFLTWIIRSWGAYPDGLAFAVLIMNSLVPLFDHFTRPRVLGESVVE